MPGSLYIHTVLTWLEPALEYYPLLNSTLNKPYFLLSKNWPKKFPGCNSTAGSNHASTVNVKKLITGSLLIWNQESILTVGETKSFKLNDQLLGVPTYVHPFCLNKLNWKLLKGERNCYILWEKITVIAICEMLLCFWVTWLGVNLIQEHMSFFFLVFYLIQSQ